MDGSEHEALFLYDVVIGVLVARPNQGVAATADLRKRPFLKVAELGHVPLARLERKGEIRVHRAAQALVRLSSSSRYGALAVAKDDCAGFAQRSDSRVTYY